MQSRKSIKPLISIHPGMVESKRFDVLTRRSEKVATDFRQIAAELRGYLVELSAHSDDMTVPLAQSMHTELDTRLSKLSGFCRTLNGSCNMTAHLIQRLYESLGCDITKPTPPKD